MPPTAPTVPFLSPAAIESEAARLRDRYTTGGIPIDPYALATRMGIDVFQSTFEDKSIAGAIRWQDGRPEILVRGEDALVRQTFTVAHELAHYVLHWGGCQPAGTSPGARRTFVDSDLELYRHETDGDDPEPKQSGDRERRNREIQANMFAAALLMPEAEVRAEWGLHKDIKTVARKFKVSQMAMRYRIEQLGIW